MSPSKRPGGYRRLAYPVADYVESQFRRRVAAAGKAPIVILGPPRSGTTLLYQALTDRFRVSWFCNMADQKAEWPCLSTWVVRRKFASYRSDYESRYGKTRGRAGPAEARRLWSKWFGYDYADESTSAAKIDECRRVVNYVASTTGLPFVTKNPDHCIRIRALNLAFPDALYVRIRRRPIDVARSILNARKKYLGSYEKWFGVCPPEITTTKDMDATDQALMQVMYLEDRLNEDFGKVIRDGRQIEVDYEEFCDAPDRFLDSVRSIASSCGIDLLHKGPIRPQFGKSQGQRLDDDLERRLRLSLDKISSLTTTGDTRRSLAKSQTLFAKT